MAQQLRALYVGLFAEAALVRLVLHVCQHVATHNLHCVRAVAALKHVRNNTIGIPTSWGLSAVGCLLCGVTIFYFRLMETFSSYCVYSGV